YRLQNLMRQSPGLVQPVEAVKRPLAVGDFAAARAALGELETALREAGKSPDTIADVRDALAPDAYWRQAPWKRILVIFAGPGTNMLFAIIVFAILFMTGGGKATTTVDQVVSGTPAAHMGLRADDKVIAIDGKAVDSPADIPKRISHSQGRPVTLQVARDDRIVILEPAKPEKLNRV